MDTEIHVVETKRMRLIVILSVLALVLSIAGTINITNSRLYQTERATPAGTRGYIDAQLLFGSFEVSGDNSYYVALDTGFNFYIVKLDDAAFKRCGEIYAYSNSVAGGGINTDIGSPPTPVRLAGVTTEIDDEISSAATEAFNGMANSDAVNEENFSAILGSNYLDTTGYLDLAWYVNFIPSALCLAAAVVLLFKHYRAR